MSKLNLGLLFGGRSCEHEVSVTSARSIYKAIDNKKYKVSLIGIDKTGRWHLADNFEQLVTDGEVKANNKIGEVTLSLHDGGNLTGLSTTTVTLPACIPKLDILFPALHGTFGEDGAIQGVFEMAGIPYVGCGVAASALAMDKILAKKILKNAGIPQADYLAVKQTQWQNAADEITTEAEKKLGYPLFIKPANAGSSVGVNRVTGRQELSPAIQTAFQYDNKIVIEQAMQNCREVECAILGNSSDDEGINASVVGEIIPGGEFYDYQTKYLDDKSQLIVPANLPEKVATKIRQLARQAFIEIDAAGLARVDFFVNKKTNQITLNEINTLPGFTPISMYPKLWQATKIPYDELINKLITLSQKSHKQKTNLKRGI